MCRASDASFLYSSPTIQRPLHLNLLHAMVWVLCFQPQSVDILLVPRLILHVLPFLLSFLPFLEAHFLTSQKVRGWFKKYNLVRNTSYFYDWSVIWIVSASFIRLFISQLVPLRKYAWFTSCIFWVIGVGNVESYVIHCPDTLRYDLIRVFGFMKKTSNFVVSVPPPQRRLTLFAGK